MLIGVISDTHDRLDSIERALAFFAQQSVELVIHCGDWKVVPSMQYFAEKAAAYRLPVRGVLGNNDHDTEAFIRLAKIAPGDFLLEEGVFELTLDDTSVAIYHGHHAPTLRKVLENPDYDFVFVGHTHKPRIDTLDHRLIINPGSTAFAIPRSKTWQPSVAIADTKSRTAEVQYI